MTEDILHRDFNQLEKMLIGLTFAIKECGLCGWYVECPKCGSNSCGGGRGWVDKDGKALPWNTKQEDRQPCDICDFAYGVQKGLEMITNPPENDYEKLYHELIYQVESKHPNESRHETALRYIKERENRKYEGVDKAVSNITTEGNK